MSIRAASASLIQYLWCVFIMIAFNYTITDYTEVTVFLQHCWKFAGLMSETKSDFFFFHKPACLGVPLPWGRGKEEPSERCPLHVPSLSCLSQPR